MRVNSCLARLLLVGLVWLSCSFIKFMQVCDCISTGGATGGANYYSLLGVEKSADETVIKKAYRRMAMKV